ncbi:MAG: hypothetical protein RIQ71_1656 [Verrucomicrobiota bacterium]|jgi:SAM-dependent methyltransferase
MNTGHYHCHHCRAVADAPGQFHVLDAGVTSDCRPWREAIQIFVCPACGAAQAPVSEEWRQSVQRIYRDYDTYAAAGGEEQKVIGENADGMSARSRVIADWLASLGLVGDVGEVLDVGCGRGAFLAEFARRFPAWTLSGSEFDDRNIDVLRSLPKFNRLQTCRFESLGGDYEVISMIHVLEHIEDPVACLAALRRRARTGALLLVQVPDWSENPFALAIADHATHFTPEVLAQVARRAGWEPIGAPSHVVPKELTLLAKATDVTAASRDTAPDRPESRLGQRLSWLHSVGLRAHSLRKGNSSFGIFGTAIAGTWLAGVCNMKVDFFVDEDPCRIGSRHLGIPILSPQDIPAGSDVFVGMAPAVSKRLAEKYSGSPANFHAVDAFTAL